MSTQTDLILIAIRSIDPGRLSEEIELMKQTVEDYKWMRHDSRAHGIIRHLELLEELRASLLKDRTCPECGSTTIRTDGYHKPDCSHHLPF
jgi:hypothetical protein